MTGSIIAESQHIPIRDINNNRLGQAGSVPVESFRVGALDLTRTVKTIR